MLSNTWLTDITTDFEYKKYIVLDYIQKVNNYFNQVKIYPHLVDIHEHYNNLIIIKKQQANLIDSFPKKIRSIDLKNNEIIYEPTIVPNGLKQIDKIIDYSLPKFKNLILAGEEMEVLVKENSFIEPLGIVPIYQKEGYLFLKRESESNVFIYEYQHRNIFFSKHSISSIVTKYISTENCSFKTIVSLKNNLIKKIKKLPNPATYLFHSSLSFPLEETLLPQAKKRLLAILSTS